MVKDKLFKIIESAKKETVRNLRPIYNNKI